MYNGYTNYSTWAIFNYISSNEESYNKYYKLCDKISAGTGPDIYALKNALEDDFKRPGIIDTNESERAGLYADILDDALSEIDFMEVATAFYLPFSG